LSELFDHVTAWLGFLFLENGMNGVKRSLDTVRRHGRSQVGKPVRTLAALLLLFLSRPATAQDVSARLLEAVKTRDTTQVQKLLAEGADANARDKDGFTPLIWAASFGRTENVLALLKKGADVNAKDKTGWTALMGAARKGHTATVLALLAMGADVTAKDNNGWTALMSGSVSGRLDTVLVLLEKDADVNAKDKVGWTALIGATNAGQIEIVRALLRKGADPNAQDSDGDTALSLARKHNYSEVLALLENPPGPRQSKTPKKAATAGPDVSPVDAAPRSTATTRPPPAAGVSSAAIPQLQPATGAGSTSIPNPQPAPVIPESSPSLASQLLVAAQAGDTADVQSLLAKGVDINSRGAYGNTPLMSAALTGHTDTVRVLLERGADVNAKGNTGRTALMEAAGESYTDVVRLLLEKGADVNAKDDGGWTALFWAAFSQRSGTVRVLLEKGADVNARNKYNDTALIRASYGGDMQTVKALLEYKADVNARDDMGRTALMEAARQGHADAVRALQEKGADAQAQDHDGETALSLAEKQKHPEVIELLKNPERTPRAVAAPQETNAPHAVPYATGVSVVDKRARGQAYFRIGLKMQMVEVWWPQRSELAAGWAQSIQQDLPKVGAPSELSELASQAEIHLKISRKENNGSVARLIHDLRAGLDGFCNSHTEEKFFYTAGSFAYRLTLLAEDLRKPPGASASIAGGRREILPLATAMANQCLATEGCKELALIYFSDAATILKKAQVTANEGTALLGDATEIEKALDGEQR
jgi:ankyrin repeat protein